MSTANNDKAHNKTPKASAKPKKTTKAKKSTSVKRVTENEKTGTNVVKHAPESVKSGANQSSPATNNNGKNKEEKKKKSSTTRNAKGQFVKGAAKPANSGRKPGTPNKYGNIRDRLKSIILPYLNTDPDAPEKTLGKDLMRLDSDQRVDAIAKYLPFLVPKYSSTTITADANRPVAEEDRLLDLDKEYKKKETEITIKTLTVVDNDNDGTPVHLTKEQLSKDLGL